MQDNNVSGSIQNAPTRESALYNTKQFNCLGHQQQQRRQHLDGRNCRSGMLVLTRDGGVVVVRHHLFPAQTVLVQAGSSRDWSQRMGGLFSCICDGVGRAIES
jgi:hypothetical protein